MRISTRTNENQREVDGKGLRDFSVLNLNLAAGVQLESRKSSIFGKMAAHIKFAAACVTALTLSVLVTACTTGPEYKKPSDSNLSTLHNTKLLDARQADAPMPSLDIWWTGFQDPVLTNIIERVLTQNLDLATSFARVDQTRAVARGTGARRLPQANAMTAVTRERQSLNSPLGEIASAFPGYQRTQTEYDVGVGASWELDLFGGLKRGAEAADAEEEAAEADHLGVRISVAAEAADAYFRIRGAQARIALAENQVKTNVQLLELVQLRMHDGLSTVLEQAQAEARVSESRASVPPLITEREKQLNRLDVLMGVQPGTSASELMKTANTSVVPAIAVAENPAELMRRRPDVIAAERRVAASNAKIGEAMAEYYPKLSLSGLLGFTSLGSSGILASNSFQPSIGLGMQWRLFDFGRIDAEIARAKGVNSEALIAYRMAMLRTTEDVENSIVALAQLEEESRELMKEVDAHQRARNASEDAYKGGAVSLTEVLYEDRLLLAAQDQLAQAHADNARAAVATFRALGGGW
jgi:NodT family efflux transporter outer membrane factor (OMF) lipoprotein